MLRRGVVRATTRRFDARDGARGTRTCRCASGRRGAFGSSNIIVLKILGIGTAVAVLTDALLVRCLLLPASLRLLGPRAWWLPAPLRRLHRRISREERLESEPCPQAVPEQ